MADGCLRGPIQLPIHIRVPHDGLHILARFREWNGLDEFLDIAIFPCRLPVTHAIVSGIVSGESVLEASELVHHGAEIARTQLQVHGWRKQLLGSKML